MARTRDELVNKALEILIVKEVGQAAEAEDFELVDAEVLGLLDELSILNITDEIDADAVDDVVFIHIASLLAHRVAPEFGIGQDEAKKLRTENLLRELRAPKLLDNPIEVDYF